ncbi:hypothetical protein JCM1841_003732 [Sporobolomyces salmonicolor]
MPSRAAVTPLSQLRTSSYQLPAHGRLPNTSLQRRPLLIYHGAFPPSSCTASTIEAHLAAVGAVVPQWRYSMYPTTHFHSTSHEVLCVCAGRAELCFGGKDNPERAQVVAQKGDVIVVPAGVGHRLLEDLEGGFEMVGSYPPGCSWDMCYGKEGEEDKGEAIKKLKWFERDPIYGEEGPALEV